MLHRTIRCADIHKLHTGCLYQSHLEVLRERYNRINAPINSFSPLRVTLRSSNPRQHNQKIASSIQLALRPNRSPLRLHHVPRNRKPQPRPARLPRPRLIHPVKPLEDPPQVLRSNPLPKVPHAELHRLTRLQPPAHSPPPGSAPHLRPRPYLIPFSIKFPSTCSIESASA